jgi:curved DNA-binding protein CbpA
VNRDPFGVLGLERSADLADDEVRAAWRRLAAATHPDRADGGDPAAFAAAAAADTVLRTRTGRGEALADLLAPGAPARPRAGPGLAVLARRIRRGRPLVLALRVLAVAAVSVIAVAAAGWRPATPAVMAGAVTWLALTARRDLAPPPL